MKTLLWMITCSFLFAAPAMSEKLPAKFNLQKITSKSKLGSKNWKKKFTVVQFWASWCDGCSKNMKKLANWKKAKKVPFKHVTVSVDETLAEAKKYLQDLPTKYKQLKRISFFDTGTVLASSLDVEAVPATFVINSKREIVGKIIGTLDAVKMKQLKEMIKGGV
ncbi:TlpA family protein disulfide reductase [Oligoflexaceae bacterium]|nr:TlpA family protein disulfide reductase [Oligoflexaceae bacterium]